MTTDPAADELLLDREAQGLQVPAIARIGLSLFGAYTSLDGIPSLATRSFIWSLVAASIVLNGYSVYALRRRRHVSRIGWLGVGLDAIVVLVYPFITLGILGGYGLHWAYGFKGLIVVVYITLVTINGTALKPAYPAVIGAVAVVVMTAQLILARADPALVWADAASYVGPELSYQDAVTQIVFLLMCIGLVVFMTAAARAAVLEAISRRAERDRLQRAHEASVMEGRLDALRNLVASLSHELNTPLGAIKSSVDTIDTAAGRVRDRLEASDVADPKATKLLALIGDTAKVSVTASERIDEVVKRMAVFAALDRADAEAVDVNEAIERTLGLVPRATVGDTRVVTDLAARRAVRLSAPRLNLALMTVLTNAFEAVRGQGEVRVATSDEGAVVRVVVTDTGPGIPPELVAGLFEFRFDRTGDRVKAGLGLPAAYSLLRKHGGDIRVEPPSGSGATLVLDIPHGGLAPSPAQGMAEDG